MADNTAIEWTDATWNPITGCSIVSPGCTNCYAMKLAGMRLKHTPSRAGLTVDSKTGPVWNGQVRLNEQWLGQPLRWKRPRRIFVCAHGDLFAENVPDEWIDRVFAVMAGAPQHTFQVLTKRAARMREYLQRFKADGQGWMTPNGEDGYQSRVPLSAEAWPLPNVWLGVSAERQQEADERIPDLLATPAVIRFVSAEPLLGPIDFTNVFWPQTCECQEYVPALNAFDGTVFCEGCCEGAERLDIGQIDWIIVGGESGASARPMHPDWVRAIRDQCADANVAFFLKQWGEWAPGECANHPQTRTEDVAQYWSDDWGKPAHWTFDRITKRYSEEMHRDDEPDVWRMGKRRAGRMLDGVEHSEFPELPEVPFR